jgi:hypothetical protein
MAKKRNYEWDRRVRLGELLRREGELPVLRGPEGAFILGPGNRVVTTAKSDPSSKDTTSSDEISVSLGTDQIPPPSAKSSPSADSMAIHPANPNSMDSLQRRRQPQQLFLRATNTPIARLPGISIFYTGAPTSHSLAPHTFRHFLEHFPALHSTCIFLHVRTAAQPHVPYNEKLVMEASPLWDGVWRGVYRVGYMETPDFTAAEFTLQLFEKLGRQVDGLTHVLQYTALKARAEKEKAPFIKRIPMKIRAFAIDVVWSGIDEVIGGVGKGWKVPVGEVVSVGSVAEV